MKFTSFIPLILSQAKAASHHEMHFLFAVESHKSPLSRDEEPLRDAYFAQDDMLAVADGGASNWTIEGLDTARYANELVQQICSTYSEDKK